MNQTNDIPLVSVCCLAHNHENIIKKTIEGILMQRTEFQFEVIIHDDGSTDGTAEIIKDYANKFPEKIKPIIQTTNKYATEGLNLQYNYVFPHARGKYIAFCDGDDFWIDPLKLQKQVDFLEQNTEYGLVHTKAVKFYTKSGMFGNVIGLDCPNFEQLVEESTIVNSTICMRHSLFKMYIEEVKPETRKNWSSCNDFPIWLWLIQHSKFKFLDDITVVYNILEGSMSQQVNLAKRLNWFENINDIVDYFLEQYGSDSLTKKIRAIYTSGMINEVLLMRKWEGVRRGIKVFYQAKDWLNLLWLLLTLPFYYFPFFIKCSYYLRRNLIGHKYRNL